MASHDHLMRLKDGVKAWNEWRKEYPETTPDLAGAELSMTDLRMADLGQADLAGADLRGSLLSGQFFRTVFCERPDSKVRRSVTLQSA